jgi:hypothetical protein
MQLKFANPSGVSGGNDNDKMVMEVLELSLFKSKMNLKQMSTESFNA